MLDFHPESKRTDVKQEVEFLSSVQKRRTTAFILSDFYVRNDFMQSLQIANRKHDVVAIQVYDQRAKELPDVGLMRVVDAETGFEQYVDTSSKRLRDSYRKYWMNRQTQLLETFNKSNVDNVSIATNEDFVKALMMLFKQRS
jgi:DNA-binding transcriptional regulator YbjK